MMALAAGIERSSCTASRGPRSACSPPGRHGRRRRPQTRLVYLRDVDLRTGRRQYRCDPPPDRPETSDCAAWTRGTETVLSAWAVGRHGDVAAQTRTLHGHGRFRQPSFPGPHGRFPADLSRLHRERSATRALSARLVAQAQRATLLAAGSCPPGHAPGLPVRLRQPDRVGTVDIGDTRSFTPFSARRSSLPGLRLLPETRKWADSVSAGLTTCWSATSDAHEPPHRWLGIDAKPGPL